MSSPTARSTKYLTDRGYMVGMVERYNSFTKRKNDLFGFIDLLAVGDGQTIGVQVTSGANHAARRTKILAEPRAKLWLAASNRILIHSWDKQGPRGKRKVWTLREEWLTEQDFHANGQVCHNSDVTMRTGQCGPTGETA